MSKLRYIAAIAIIVTCTAVMTGCFDRRELDTLGIVMGVAIDKGENEGETKLTIQMANPAGTQSSKSKSKGKSGGEESGGGKAFINITDTGQNINYIVREMQHKMSRRIYVAHNQVILLGEELAKSGVRDALDFFARAPEARMTLSVFVVKGNASEALNVEPEFEHMPSVELAKLLNDQKITSHAPIITEFEFVSTMVSKTTAPVAPLVTIEEEEDGRQMLVVEGSAVFKSSVMVGELNEQETRGLLLVKNKVKTGVMQMNILDTPTTMEIRQAKSRVDPVLYTDGTTQFNVDIQMTTGLGDQSGTTNLSDPDNVPAMLRAVESVIKEEIVSAVTKSKEYDADIFGFGEYLNRKYPDQWKEMQNNWDELYKNISVNVTVKAKADGGGRIVKPLVPEG